MRDRPDPKALLRAYKACLDKLDAQLRGLLTEASVADPEKTIWLHDDFNLPRGARLEISISVGLRLPRQAPRPLMIEGPKR